MDDEVLFRKAVGKRIARAREAKGWSQTTLARAMGDPPVHDTVVSRWERGHALPSTRNLVRLARILEVPTETFFHD